MTFVRAIVNDLVERKLWPVALLLVVALVATPVVLGRGAGEAVDTAATQPATSPSTADDETASLAEVTLDEQEAPARRDRGGETRNPFKRPESAKAETTAEETTPAPAPTPVTPEGPVTTGGGSTSGDTTSGGSTSGGATSGGSTSGGSSSSTPKAKTTHHVTLRVGTTGNQKTIRDIPRLAALPSVTDPFFVYLGVLKDGKTAVFMVSDEAVATGDGKCKPSAASCETIEMKAGTTEWFDRTNSNTGEVVQYQMDLVSIRKRKISSVDAVRAAYARHSNIGAELLRDAAVSASALSKGAKRYRYLPKRGVLVRAKTRKRAAATATAGALVPGASEAVGLAPRKKQPGVAVWHWDAGKAER